MIKWCNVLITIEADISPTTQLTELFASLHLISAAINMAAYCMINNVSTLPCEISSTYCVNTTRIPEEIQQNFLKSFFVDCYWLYGLITNGKPTLTDVWRDILAPDIFNQSLFPCTNIPNDMDMYGLNGLQPHNLLYEPFKTCAPVVCKNIYGVTGNPDITGIGVSCAVPREASADFYLLT
jgi:hypothetical protein